jgi:transcriptional regulator with XRE-family HTH domain
MRDCPHLLEALAITVEKLRKERKLTKTALANFSDLQECYIRGITKGRRNPTVTALYAICEALEVSPEEFFGKVSAEMEGLAGSADDE